MISQQFLSIAVVFFLFSSQVFAETKISKKRAEIDSQKVIEVRYSNSAWNKDPSEIDTGIILLKDSTSGKTLQIPLEETAPDSGIYSGVYSINWGAAEGIKPEVYVLNSDRELNEKQLKEILQKIDKGQIKRKPLFYKKNETGKQTLQVFENKEQMEQAVSAIRAQNQQTVGMDLSSVTNKEFSTAKAMMTSQELSQFAQNNDQRKKDAQKRLIDRIRQEQSERARIQSLQNAHDALSKVEQDKRKKQAEDFAESALDLYRGGQYVPAEENFRKSFELNPENKKYYFQYGMTLYKNSKYSDAIVAFNISKSNKDYELESIYYAALAEYNLKEYEQAMGRFNELEQKKDKEMSPLASFYAGIIYYEQKDYDKAKNKFQVVLDTSNDPKLDEKAEKYIDDINQAITFAKNKQKTVFLSGTVGSMYDSNVLLQSDSSADQGTAQGKSSLRYILGIGAYYRGIYSDKYEFGPKFRTDYIFTQNSALTDYDPWSVQVTTPFSYKTTIKKKAMKLDIKPGFEVLYLGQDATSGRPKKTLQGRYIEVAPTFIMTDRWLSTYSLTYRKDSFVQSSDQDENANKITFKFSNLLFVNKPKTKSVLVDLGYTTNSATGSTYNYKRYDATALYIAPVFKNKANFAGGLSLYKLNYADRSTPQHDFNKTLTATLSKPLTENVSGTILGTYTLNDSNSASSDYNKWTLGILFNAEFGL